MKNSSQTLLLLSLFSFGITSPHCGEKNALASENYPLPEMPRTLLRIKTVPNNAAFCKQHITMGIPVVFRCFSDSSPTVPKAPTTICTTATLTSHNFCNCNLKPCYLVTFPSSFLLMFWSTGSLFSLSMNTISGLRWSISLSVWITKSQSILRLSFTSTSSSWYEHHLSSH